MNLLALPRGRLRAGSLLFLSVSFVAAGVNHFLDPDVYLAIMPPYLPAHALLVALSGVLEVAGGVGMIIPRLRRRAGWMVALLLFAVFPANVHMAVNAEDFAAIPSWALWLRLPLQFVLIAWVVWSTQGESSAAPAESRSPKQIAGHLNCLTTRRKRIAALPSQNGSPVRKTR